MSDAESEATRDAEYYGRREDLIEQAKEKREEAEEQHNALLKAAAEGEEVVIEEFDTVEIGSAELTVATQIPGEVMRKLDRIYEGDLPPGRALDVYIDVLAEQTQAIEANGVTVESKADVRRFFRDFIDRHDAESAAMLALERVIEEPNELEEKRRQEAMQSFPGDTTSPRDRGVSDWRS